MVSFMVNMYVPLIYIIKNGQIIHEIVHILQKSPNNTRNRAYFDIFETLNPGFWGLKIGWGCRH